MYVNICIWCVCVYRFGSSPIVTMYQMAFKRKLEHLDNTFYAVSNTCTCISQVTFSDFLLSYCSSFFVFSHFNTCSQDIEGCNRRFEYILWLWHNTSAEVVSAMTLGM